MNMRARRQKQGSLQSFVFGLLAAFAVSAILEGCPPNPSGGEGEGEGQSVEGQPSEGETDTGAQGLVLITYLDYGMAAKQYDTQGVLVAAQFALYEGEHPEETMPVLDTCTFTVTEPEEKQYSAVPLDPGAPGIVDNGTATAALVRVAATPDAAMPLDYTAFSLAKLIDSRFKPGDLLSISWPGGADLPPFEIQGPVLSPLSFSQPPSVIVFGSTIFSADLSQDLPLTWDAGNAGDFVTVQLKSYGDDTPGNHGGKLTCNLRDDGSYVIPASELAKLSATPDSEIITFVASRTVINHFTVTSQTHGAAKISVLSSTPTQGYLEPLEK